MTAKSYRIDILILTILISVITYILIRDLHLLNFFEQDGQTQTVQPRKPDSQVVSTTPSPLTSSQFPEPEPEPEQEVEENPLEVINLMERDYNTAKRMKRGILVYAVRRPKEINSKDMIQLNDVAN